MSGSLENEVKEKKLEVRALNESLALLRSKVNTNNREEALTIYKASKEKIETFQQTGSAFEISPSRLKEQHKQKQTAADKSASYLKSLHTEQADLEAEIERNKQEIKSLKGKKKVAAENQLSAFELDLEDIKLKQLRLKRKQRHNSMKQACWRKNLK